MDRVSTIGFVAFRFLTLHIAVSALSSIALASTAAPIYGLDTWYVDQPGRTIYEVSAVDGSVLTSFTVPAQVVTPTGLAVSG